MDGVIEMKCYTGAVISAVMISGCSPYVYEKEVSQFSASVSTLKATSSGAQSALLADQIENIRVKAILRQRDDLRLSATGCFDGLSTVSEFCHASFGGEATTFLDDDDILSINGRKGGSNPVVGTNEILVSLDRYSKALASITNAEDRARFDAAAQSLQASTVELVSLSGTQGAATTPLVGGGIGLLAGVSATYFDTRRQHVLKKVVLRMNGDPDGPQQGVVPLLVRKLENSFERFRTRRIQELSKREADLEAGLQDAVRRKSDVGIAFAVDGFVNLADELNALNAADPTKVINSFEAAHNALATALKDDSKQIEPVSAATSALLDQVTALKQALSDED